jgi:hypothetical protein
MTVVCNTAECGPGYERKVNVDAAGCPACDTCVPIQVTAAQTKSPASGVVLSAAAIVVVALIFLMI